MWWVEGKLDLPVDKCSSAKMRVNKILFDNLWPTSFINKKQVPQAGLIIFNQFDTVPGGP